MQQYQSFPEAPAQQVDALPHPTAIDHQSIVDVSRFGVRPDCGEDATPGIRAAIERCRITRASRLVLPSGRYDLWPDGAEEHFLFVSNNDGGLKRIGFPLLGIDGLEIDARGASLMFHGPMVPFYIGNSRGVSLRNLSFDFERSFHSEALVLDVAPGSVDIEICAEYPYAIRNGILVFTDSGCVSGPETTVGSGERLFPYTSLLAFDSARRETAFMAHDLYGVGAGIVASEIGHRRVRLHLDNVSATPGDILVFGAPRHFPGIVISDSSQIRLENVTVHHCGGMAVIAQRSRDLFLKSVRVTPPAGGKRVVSATADATHFVNCRGRIEMRDCLFELQKDDATNIHGLYAKVTRVLSPTKFEIRMIHPQQAGLDFVHAGTRLEVVDGPSLEAKAIATVRIADRSNSECSIIETTEPVEMIVGDAVADADANTAEVLIKNCVIRGNRARGLLLGSRGRTVVEGNTFHTPGSAILFEGDASFWFEQAGVRNVVIRGNTFDNCNFGVWGKACIEVKSGIADEFRKTSRYNKNILIEDNRFRVFGPQPLLGLYSVEQLTFRENTLERTNDYPVEGSRNGELFNIVHSDNVSVENPLPGMFISPAPHAGCSEMVCS